MSRGLTIIGLGPGDPALLTLEAQHTLSRLTEVVLHTRQHPIVPRLPGFLRLRTLAELGAGPDEQLEALLALAERADGVAYAVPGHPLDGGSGGLAARLLALARERGLPARLVAGLSWVDAALAGLGLDLAAGLQVLDAAEVARAHHPPLNPDRPALLGGLDPARASELRRALLNLYPADHPVTLWSPDAAGATTPLGALGETPLPPYAARHSDAARHSYAALYIPPLPEPGSLEAFQEVVAHLRAPDGCPWDREQTHASLRNSLLEETYEVLAALDEGDAAGLREELGDLMLQAVLHTQIAIDEGEFRMADVVHHIVTKLIRRHPHVFAGRQVGGAGEVLRNWEEIKAAERAAQPKPKTLFSGVPLSLPALNRAQAIQERASRVGFDWPDITGVVAKIREEADELLAADEGAREGELGDLLFSVVNVARWLGLDAETALRGAANRFVARYEAMERLAAERGLALAALDLAAQDALWEEVKAAQTRGAQARGAQTRGAEKPSAQTRGAETRDAQARDAEKPV